MEGQGRLDEAAALYIRALQVFRHGFGPASSEVAFTLAALGGVRQAQGRLALAERLMRRALAMQEALYGFRHPEVALTVHNLAVLIALRGRATEARALGRRALVVFARVLGPRHPHTRRCRETLPIAGECGPTRQRLAGRPYEAWAPPPRRTPAPDDRQASGRWW